MTTDMCVADTKAVERLEEKLDGLEDAMQYTAIQALMEGASVTDHLQGGFTNGMGRVCALQAMAIAARARHLI